MSMVSIYYLAFARERIHKYLASPELCRSFLPAKDPRPAQ